MRVILATDGAIEADLAEAIALKLPLPSDASICVAMATYPTVPIGIGLVPETTMLADRWVVENHRIQRMIADQTVRRVCERLRDQGLAADSIVLEGDPAEQIEKLAASEAASLVVVGCGFESQLTALLLGSVSRHLVLHCPCSVLVGKHLHSTPPEGSFRRTTDKVRLDAMIAVDGSSGADMAVQSLEGCRAPAFRKLFVICVDPMRSWPMMDLGVAYTSAAESVAQKAADRLKQSAEEVVVLTASGRPSTAIVQSAQEHDVDLVILGANRHGALERLFAGSCAFETATTAPCSVLVLRDVLAFA